MRTISLVLGLVIVGIVDWGYGATIYRDIEENNIGDKSPWKAAFEDVKYDIKQSLYKDTKRLQQEHEDNLRMAGQRHQEKLMHNMTIFLENFLSDYKKDDLPNIWSKKETPIERISYDSEENSDLIKISHSMTVNNETKEGVTYLSTSEVGPFLKEMFGEIFSSEDFPIDIFFLITSVIVAPILLTLIPALFALGIVPLVFFIFIFAILTMVLIPFLPFIMGAFQALSWVFDESDHFVEAVSKEDVFYNITETTTNIEDYATTVTEFVTNVPRYFN